MLVIDMSQFFHMDRTQMSSSKLFSIMRVEIQVNVKKKKKKHMKASGKGHMTASSKGKLLKKDNCYP